MHDRVAVVAAPVMSDALVMAEHRLAFDRKRPNIAINGKRQPPFPPKLSDLLPVLLDRSIRYVDDMSVPAFGSMTATYRGGYHEISGAVSACVASVSADSSIRLGIGADPGHHEQRRPSAACRLKHVGSDRGAKVDGLGLLREYERPRTRSGSCGRSKAPQRIRHQNLKE